MQNTDWLLKETKYPFGGAAFDLAQYRYLSPKLMRIVLRDGGACNTVLYLQMNWHGDFYRDYTANGDSFTVQQGDEWGNWPRARLACNTPHAYHWNAQWGYQFFDELGAPNGGNPPLGLYYAHGRWYNPEVGLWLSPDEKGEYFYGGDAQDPVNFGYVGAPAPLQQGNTLSLADFTALANAEEVFLDLSAGVSPFPSALSKIPPSLLAAYAAVGEMNKYCQFMPNRDIPEAIERQCKQAFGAVIATVKNRYNCILGLPDSRNCDRGWPIYGGRASTTTYSRILLGGCAGAPCTQYEGLRRWLTPGDLSFTGPNPTAAALTSKQYEIAVAVALLIFSGDNTFGSDIIGTRTDFVSFERIRATLGEQAADKAKRQFCSAQPNCFSLPFAPLVVFY